jgi:hypothetical protein
MITLEVPNSLKEWQPLLQDFFNGMMKKLDKNSHKKTPTINSLPEIMDLLELEIDEFEEQITTNKFDENSLIELMDQANFSFLAYVALRSQGVEHGTESKTGSA